MAAQNKWLCGVPAGRSWLCGRGGIWVAASDQRNRHGEVGGVEGFCAGGFASRLTACKVAYAAGGHMACVGVLPEHVGREMHFAMRSMAL